MMNKIRTKIDLDTIIKGIVFFMVFIVSLVYFTDASFRNNYDDEVFKNAIRNYGSWFNWIETYFNLWSGRVIIHTLLVILLNLPVAVFKVLSSFVMAFSCYTTYKIASIGAKSRKSYILCSISTIIFLLLFFSIGHLSDIIKWVTGSITYFYPVAALLAIIYCFSLACSNEKIPLSWKIVCSVSVIICANMEQTACVAIAVGFLIFLYLAVTRNSNNKADKIFLLVIWILAVLVFVLSYFSPGNSVRYNQELLQCIGYGMYTTPQKFLLGMQLDLLYLMSAKGLILFLLPSVLCIVICIRKKEKKKMFLPILNIIIWLVEAVLIRKLFNIEFIYPYNSVYLYWIAATCLAVFYYGFVLIKVVPKFSDKYICVIIYLASLASGAAVAFSPTIYVSAHRTMYITYVLLILLSIKVFFITFCQQDNTPEQVKYFSFNRCYGVLSVLLTVVMAVWFVVDYHSVASFSATDIIMTDKYEVKEIEVDSVTGQISGKVKVDQFIYIADNWALGRISGYDINVSVGKIDNNSMLISEFTTLLTPSHPIMDEFEGGYIGFTGYLNNQYTLEPDEDYVLIIKDHDKNVFYKKISQS